LDDRRITARHRIRPLAFGFTDIRLGIRSVVLLRGCPCRRHSCSYDQHEVDDVDACHCQTLPVCVTAESSRMMSEPAAAAAYCMIARARVAAVHLSESSGCDSHFCGSAICET